MKRKHLECLVCESKELNPLPNYEIKGLIKCQKCGFIYMEQIPSIEDLDSHYKTYSYSDHQYLSPLTIESYNILLNEFEKYRNTNKLLDVGCGRGYFLKEAKKRGWEVFGTEYSEKAVEICTNEGINMKIGKLSPNLFEIGDFDIITSFEVLEHINNPNEELRNINALLRNGGLFYCTTPNFNSLLRYYLKSDYNIITYPEHLSYYVKSTLNKMLTQNGFKNIKFLSTGISITRLKTSKKLSNEKIIEEKNSDEILRQNISKKWYLKIAKDLTNLFLTLTNSGLTLKGYYVKK